MQLAWVNSPLFLVYALAALRLTRLWTTDSLPPLPQLRASLHMWLARRRARDVNNRLSKGTLTPIEAARDHHMSKLLTCAWCVGFWISAAVVLAASSPIEPYLRLLALALAFSAIVGLLSGREEN